MILFFVVCTVFLFMLIFPIYIGIKTAQSESEPLLIQKSNTRNPRYFAMSFKSIIEKAWESYEGFGILKMSQYEEIIEVDKVELSTNKARGNIEFGNNCKVYVLDKNIETLYQYVINNKSKKKIL